MLEAPTTRQNADVEDNLENQDDGTPDTNNQEKTPDVDTTTEETDQDKAYKDAWDNIDLDGDLNKFYEKPADDTNEPTQEPKVQDDVNVDADDNSNTDNPSDGLLIPNPILKFRGKDVPVSSSDEMVALAQKGLLLELEMQKIKPQKRLVKLIEDAGISEEDIQAVVDLSKGNAQALNFLAIKFNINVPSQQDNDIFSDKEPPVVDTYAPQVVPEDPVKTYWDEYVQSNPGQSGKVFDIYNGLDETFKSEIYKDGIFQNFVDAVTMGEFEKAYPVTVRIKATNPAATWLQAYSMAVQSMVSGDSKPQEQKEPPASTTVTNGSVRETNPVREKDIANKVWADDKYANELMAKLFN